MWEEGGRGGERDKVLPVVTISFCWDTREHPDPQVGQGRNRAPRGATPLAGKLEVRMPIGALIVDGRRKDPS